MTPKDQTQPAPVADTGHLWGRAMPALFVCLWATGFIGAKFGLPYAEPLTFLLWRFFLLTLLLVAIALIFRAPWPKTWGQVGRIALAGLLVQGTYLGGIFTAIHLGVPAGVAALIAGLQPLLTAIAAGPLLGEKVSGRQWLGLLLGLGGVVLVAYEKLTFDPQHLSGLGFNVLAVLGITAGTLYQKKHGASMDLRTGSAIQFAACIPPFVLLAWLFETMTVQWTGEFVFALSWLVLVLSVGAISLLFMLIRRGEAARVASLFYLVPPVTALIAFFLFGETLSLTAILGMLVAVAGVAMVTKG